ncbi:cytochrome bd-type quinol oxidase subunit 1 [Rhizobium pisi]
MLMLFLAWFGSWLRIRDRLEDHRWLLWASF